jgi:ABC-type Fe3+/spermidine/putrescine transport system ATPase subunit
VLRGGVLQQVGTPDELYGAPANAFVAGFVGRVSTLPAKVLAVDEKSVRLGVEGVEWVVPTAAAGGLILQPGDTVSLTLRPEALRLVPSAPGVLVGRVTDRRFTGAQAFFRIETEQGTALELVAEPRATSVGLSVGVGPADQGVHLFRSSGS